jgi:hypothetical protein
VRVVTSDKEVLAVGQRQHSEFVERHLDLCVSDSIAIATGASGVEMADVLRVLEFLTQTLVCGRATRLSPQLCARLAAMLLPLVGKRGAGWSAVPHAAEDAATALRVLTALLESVPAFAAAIPRNPHELRHMLKLHQHLTPTRSVQMAAPQAPADSRSWIARLLRMLSLIPELVDWCVFLRCLAAHMLASVSLPASADSRQPDLVARTQEVDRCGRRARGDSRPSVGAPAFAGDCRRHRPGCEQAA